LFLRPPFDPVGDSSVEPDFRQGNGLRDNEVGRDRGFPGAVWLRLRRHGQSPLRALTDIYLPKQVPRQMSELEVGPWHRRNAAANPVARLRLRRYGIGHAYDFAPDDLVVGQLTAALEARA